MAKRFIDTGIFDDEWFSSLSSDGKIAWIYCITKCDHAGIIKINERLFQFQTGIKSWVTVSKELAKCLVTVTEGSVYFIPKFLRFQYPNFPKSNVKQQDSAIKILKSYGLWDEKTNSYLTLRQELPNSYGNGNVNGNVIGKYSTNTIFAKEISDSSERMLNCSRTLKQAKIDGSPENIRHLLRVFVTDLDGKDDTKPDLKEFQKHFINWAKINAGKYPMNNKPVSLPDMPRS